MSFHLIPRSWKSTNSLWCWAMNKVWMLAKDFPICDKGYIVRKSLMLLLLAIYCQAPIITRMPINLSFQDWIIIWLIGTCLSWIGVWMVPPDLPKDIVGDISLPCHWRGEFQRKNSGEVWENMLRTSNCVLLMVLWEIIM